MKTENFSPIRAARGEYDQRKDTRHCDSHGAYTVTVYSAAAELGVMPSGCPACSQELKDQQEKASQADQRAERMLHLKAMSRIPPKFLTARFETFDGSQNPTALAAAKDYAARWPAQLRTGESMIFLGEVGTGKTHLAIAVMQEIMERWASSVRYTTVIELVREIRAGWRDDSRPSEEAVVRMYSSFRLLVLDEAGKQYGSDAERLVLFDILNQRYLKNLPVIVMGNITLDELEFYLDKASVDRLREGGGKALKFTGTSRRRMK